MHNIFEESLMDLHDLPESFQHTVALLKTRPEISKPLDQLYLCNSQY
jgi:hypothetical protein